MSATAQASIYQFVEIPRSALIASVILHLTLPFGLLTLKVLDYFNIHVFPQSPRIHKTYQDYVQVDMVALPDIAIKDLEKLDATAPLEEKNSVSSVPAVDDNMVLESKRRENEKAKKVHEEQEKQKALAKLEEEAKREAALKELAEEGKRSRKKLKGNIESKGASTVGNIGTAKDRYDSIIQAKIKNKFFMLPNQANHGLVAIVFLELYPTGRVRVKRLERSSGDPVYDSGVLQAIDEAQPLPPPEDPAILNGGITITFRGDDATGRRK